MWSVNLSQAAEFQVPSRSPTQSVSRRITARAGRDAPPTTHPHSKPMQLNVGLQLLLPSSSSLLCCCHPRWCSAMTNSNNAVQPANRLSITGGTGIRSVGTQRRTKTISTQGNQCRGKNKYVHKQQKWYSKPRQRRNAPARKRKRKRTKTKKAAKSKRSTTTRLSNHNNSHRPVTSAGGFSTHSRACVEGSQRRANEPDERTNERTNERRARGRATRQPTGRPPVRLSCCWCSKTHCVRSNTREYLSNTSDDTRNQNE